MKKLFYLFFTLWYKNMSAQDSVWTLRDCIDYALVNNLSVRINELDQRLAAISLQNARLSYYPNLNLSTNYDMNLGRSINPTTNQFENTKFSYAGLSASSGVLLFGWFQKKHNVEKSRLMLAQSEENYEQLKNDIALNIATAYLRALLSIEQINNVAYQLTLSQNNKERIEKLLTNGKSNVLELSQASTQLSTDSSLYLEANLNYEQALIELKTLLNLDYKQPLRIELQQHEEIYFKEKPDAESIYKTALNNSHNIKASEYAIQVAVKDLRISRANSLPQLNLFYTAGTNYSSSFYEYSSTGEKQLMQFGKQLNTNLSHSVGLGLSIPVFNNFSSRNNIRSAAVNLLKSQIADLETRQKVKQDIYTACTEYALTLQRYQNALNILSHTEHAYRASAIRFEAGFINHFEYITEKNNYLKAQNEASALKYELWFKKILLERFQQGGLFNVY